MKRDILVKWGIFTVLVLLMALSEIGQSVQAQPSPDGRRGDMKGKYQRQPEKRQELIQRIRQLKIWKLTERLKLTEEQSVKFFPKYNAYQDEMVENFEKMHSLMGELRALQASNAGEAQIDQKVNDLLQVQSKNDGVLQKHIKGFREVLTARQVAELIVFEHDFMSHIREKLDEARKKGPPPGMENDHDD
ncbi:MAG: hypothetical protein HGB19_09750 [Chlorobiales bacterium]|nr:hypothetical protein [Chlorobiales bacterium]